MKIPLLSGAYEGISKNVSSQEAINFYFEPPSPRESNQGAMLPVHGAESFATLGNNGDIRGMLYDPGDELLYVVSDNDFYEITSVGGATDRGNLNTSSGHVQMAINPTAGEILVVDGTNGYIFDVSANTFTTISDGDYPDTADTCAYINGRFLVNDPTTPGRFYWSDLNDGTSWESDSFATAESIEGTIKSILVDRRSVWLFGDTKTEIFYNTGDTDFIFEQIEELDTGLVARMTPQQVDNSVVWLQRTKRGELNVVRAGDGYQPQVLSTPQISRKWHELSDISDAFAYALQIDGHEFYILTFPSGDATYAYDASTQEWHQRSGAFSDDDPTREPINAIAWCGAWGGHIAGDYQSTGKLWSLKEDVYTFDGSNMERRLTGPLIAADNEARIRFSEVQVDVEEGTITSGDSGDDRQLTLSWSKDGGHTYSSGTQLDIGESAVDGFTHRLMKRKLGWGRLWNFRIYTDTPRKIIIKGLWGRVVGEPFGGS